MVAVANELVLFAHEQAFEDKAALYDWLTARQPDVQIVEVPAADVSLDDAIRSYLFNSQLVTLPDGTMALICPSEVRENARVAAWLDHMLAGNGPIRAVHVLDVRESMRNGGGPACLRLRVAIDERDIAAIDQRFLLNPAKWDALHRLVEAWWPEQIAPGDLGNPDLWEAVWAARRALLQHLETPAKAA